MTDSILLSKKHGVNPTIPICFYCGEQKNEVALLGKLPNDVEAPRNMVLDFEPCDSCRSIIEDGVTIIEVSEKPYQYPPIQENEYPTGRYIVLKPEAADKIFPDCKHTKNEKVLCTPEVMTALSNAIEQNKNAQL